MPSKKPIRVLAEKLASGPKPSNIAGVISLWLWSSGLIAFSKRSSIKEMARMAAARSSAFSISSMIGQSILGSRTVHMARHPQRDNEQYSDEEAQRRFLITLRPDWIRSLSH